MPYQLWSWHVFAMSALVSFDFMGKRGDIRNTKSLNLKSIHEIPRVVWSGLARPLSWAALQGLKSVRTFCSLQFSSQDGNDSNSTQVLDLLLSTLTGWLRSAAESRIDSHHPASRGRSFVEFILILYDLLFAPDWNSYRAHTEVNMGAVCRLLLASLWLPISRWTQHVAYIFNLASPSTHFSDDRYSS